MYKRAQYMYIKPKKHCHVLILNVSLEFLFVIRNLHENMCSKKLQQVQMESDKNSLKILGVFTIKNYKNILTVAANTNQQIFHEFMILFYEFFWC